MSVVRVKEIQYAAEGSFAENASSLSSNTWDKRIPVLEADISGLTQERIPNAAFQNRQNETLPGHLGVRQGTFSFTCYWDGHAGVTTGSLTETWLQDLLSDALGGGNTAQVGGAVAGSGITVINLGTTHTATLVAGAIVRVGSKGDGKGDGQAAVVGTAPALITALPAAPIATDVIYATQLAYPTETPSATKRFLFGYTGTGEQWHMVGCQLAGLDFTIGTGQLPTVKLTYRCAYWGRSATSIPSAVALEDCRTAPTAGGSLFVQDVGTTTRATFDASEVTLSLDLGLANVESVSSSKATYQTITNYVRTRCIPTVTFKAPWVSTFETLYDTDGSATTHKHILFTCNPTDGRSVGFYMPRAYIASPKPTVEEINEQSYVPVTFVGREGTTTTNDLTKSAIRFFMG